MTETKIIAMDPINNIPELKEEIREVIKRFTDKDVQINMIYYETNTYRKPLKKGKKK
jgi:hypothetical protein